MALGGVKELLRIVVEADTDGAVRSISSLGKAAERDLGKAEQRIDKVGANFRKTGAVMLTAGAVMAGAMLKSVGAASDLEQAVGGTEAVFGGLSDEIDRYAKTSARSMGLSEREFRQATTSIGGQLKRMTGDVDLAAEQSVKLAGVAADLAATYGGTTAEAVQALGAAFRGEADPAERFNLNLKASAVSAKAVELGLASSTSEVSEAAKAQATLALVMEQSADAQGQFAREAGTAAGAAQIASAEFENAKASLGQSLAPVLADAAGLAANLAGKFTSLNESTGGMASKVALGATGFLLIGGAMSTAVGHAIKMRDSIKALQASMAATKWQSMIGGAGAFGAALIAVTVAANRYVDEMGEAKDQAGEWAGGFIGSFDGAKATVAEFTGEMNRLGDAHNKLIDHANNALNPFAKERYLEAADAIAVQRRSMDETLATAGRLKEQLNLTDEAALDMATNADVMAAATDNAAGEFDAQAAAAAGAEDALKEYTDTLRGTFDPLFAAQDALNDHSDAQMAVTEAQLKAKEAQDKLTAAVAAYGQNSPEATAAALEFMAASEGVDEAQRKVIRSAMDVTAETANLKHQMDIGKVSVAQASHVLGQWVAQGLLTEEQARQAGRELGVVAATAGRMGGQINYSVGVTGVARVISALDAISSRNGTSLLFNASVRAREQAYAPRQGRRTGGPIPGSPGTAVPILAHGGEYVLSADVVDRIKKGKQSLGADMSTSAASMGDVPTGGGGNMYSIVVQSLDPRTAGRLTVEAIKEYERSNGRSWRQ